MLFYLRYLMLALLVAVSALGLGLGGAWPGLGFAFSLLAVAGGDWLVGRDETTPALRHKKLLNGLLYLSAPLLLALCALLWLRVGELNPAGWPAWARGVSSFWPASGLYAPDSARAAISPLGWIGAALSVGLMIGAAGINAGHELVHRTWNPREVTLGRWLLACAGDAAFAIEHVHGHHTHVATARDPATARRGESVYAFVARSTFGQLRGAARIETARLERAGKSRFSRHNRLLRGHLLFALWLAAAFAVGGVAGLLAHLVVAVTGKVMLEIINFVEHYGLVRVEGAPVLPRHSWNSNAPLSMSALYNLPRHSHHHANSGIPYWGLQPMAGAPVMPAGYMAMLMLALAPPLFRKVMAPRLAQWDAQQASAEELRLLAA